MSEKEITRAPGSSYPLLAEPKTVRLRFCKVGRMQYISHLDLQRSFQRILARADLPLWYTQGFNPHPKIVFGLPLPVGSESICELVDIRLIRDMPCAEVQRRMHDASTAELDFVSCYIPERKLSDIAAAGYAVTVENAGQALGRAAEIKKLLTSGQLIVMKKTKSGDKETDIIPFIKNVNVAFDGERMILRLLLSAGEQGNLNPELVISVLREKLGIPGEGAEYSVLREYMADERLKEFA